MKISNSEEDVVEIPDKKKRGRPAGNPQRKVTSRDFRKSGKKVGRPVAGSPQWVWAAYYAKNPRPVPEFGEVATVVKELFAAGRLNRPLTIEEIADIVMVHHPGRDREKVVTYVKVLLTGRLRRVYGLRPWRVRVRPRGSAVSLKYCPMRYWLQGDGRRGQSKKSRKKKPTLVDNSDGEVNHADSGE